jgi:hypothetical protein
MQIWTPTEQPKDEGEFDVHFNPGGKSDPFTVIRLSEQGGSALCMQSVDECDRLIRAATKARELLATAAAREGESK